jgi:hypothetical protein
MISENQPIYDMLREIHSIQFESAKSLGRIEETIKNQGKEIDNVTGLVNKHETIYNVGKWASAPVLIAFNIGLRSLLDKLGWR